MIRQDIYLERVNWLVHCFFETNEHDAWEILSLLTDVGIPPHQYRRASEHLRRSGFDSGMTYSSNSKRESVLVISETTSKEEMVNTFSHELRHLVDDIVLTDGMAANGEEVAYLTGSIAMAMAGNLLSLACRCPICNPQK